MDTPLKAWNHNVALVLGKNNLRNLNIDGVRLIPNYSDRSGTALKIRCNNVMDGTNDRRDGKTQFAGAILIT